MKKFLIFLNSALFIISPITTLISCGEFGQSYQEFKKIDDIISEKVLGLFSHVPTNNEVLNRIQNLNPDLDLDQVEVLDNGHGQATIAVIEDSVDYQQGSTLVFYTDPENPKYSLNAMISFTNLGEYNFLPSDQAIINRVKGYNANIDVSQIEVANNGNGEATVLSVQDSTVYLSSQVKVFYTIDERPSLTDALRVNHLGQFNQRPTVSDILSRIQQLNPHLDLTQVHLTHYNTRTATIVTIPNSKIYKSGIIILDFFDPEPQHLNEVIQTVNLPAFNTIPDANDLLEAVKNANPDLNLSEVFIDSFADGQAVIKVKPDSTIYFQEEMELFYRIRLIAFIRVVDLGEFENMPNDQDLFERVKLLNSILDLNQIEVGSINKRRGRVTFRVTSNATYYQPRSQATTLFKIFLTADIKTTDLGTFTTQPNLEEITNRIHTLNPDLILDELESINIENNKIVISVIVSDIYIKGRIEFTYQIAN